MAMEDQIKAMEAAGDVKGLESAKEEAELTFEGNIAGLAEQAIARLATKAESVATTTPSQEAQINTMGGNSEEVASRTAEVHAEIVTVQNDAAAQIAEVQAQTIKTPERPPVPPLPEKKLEKAETTEQGEVEKLKIELEAQEKKSEEILNQIKSLEDRKQKIMDDKGYNQQLILAESKRIPTEQILAALLPNQRVAMENLNKLLIAASNESDKERIKQLIKKIEAQSDQNLKDLSQNLSYEWMGVRPVSLKTDSFDYSDLGRIVGSDEVARTVKYVTESGQKVLDIHDKIRTDSDLVTIEKERETLNKQLMVEGAKTWSLKDKINQLNGQAA